VNGSTCGILAGIWAALPEGGKVVLPRNCHGAVYNGLMLRHARPVYLMPEIDMQTGIFGPLSPKAVADALENNPDARLVILTSPTYEGIVSDIAAIARIAHEKGVPVLVDEAHGAHLGFGFGFPQNAIQSGVDIVVQSLHKTLPSLTQTAVLHLNGNLIDEYQIESALSIFETSSPSYLLMASISGCTALLEERGSELFRRWQENLGRVYQRVRSLKKLYLYDSAWPRDPSKLVICANRTDLTGAQLAEILRRDHRIEAEMASAHYLIAMTGMGDTAESLDALADALLAIDSQAGTAEQASFPAPVIPETALLPWEVSYRPHESVTLARASGRVSAEEVWAYPPGIPLVLPGEVLNDSLLKLLRHYSAAGVRLNSRSGQMPEKILVLSE
jgi:arginine/lysine/ornithine decarboxylase